MTIDYVKMDNNRFGELLDISAIYLYILYPLMDFVCI